MNADVKNVGNGENFMIPCLCYLKWSDFHIYTALRDIRNEKENLLSKTKYELENLQEYKVSESGGVYHDN